MAREWQLADEEPTPAPNAREIFQRTCRQRGTRINWIMSLIERGLDDEAIAARVTRRCGMATDAATVSVYRKALRGELCDMGGEGKTWTQKATADNYDRVIELRFGQKMRMGDIAVALGIPYEVVKSCMQKHRRKLRRSEA